MRKLATIRRIKDIRPIPGADNIELAIIDGWECVVSKIDGFEVGEPVIYVEVDSVLPDRPEFEFMRKRKFRVKTIKLRGQISQGLVLPLEMFPTIVNSKGLETFVETFTEGEDVTEVMGITKYDPEAEKEKAFYKGMKPNKISPIKKFLSHHALGRWILVNVLKQKLTLYFPSWIKKTDEERIQNLPKLWEHIKKSFIPLFVTEKLDGTSATYFYKDGEFGVCSRNLFLVSEDDSPYWEMAKKYRVKETMKVIVNKFHLKSLVLQGEIIGEGIQKNPYGLKERRLNLFTCYVDGVKKPHEEMLFLLNSVYTEQDTIVIPVIPLVPVVSSYLLIPSDYPLEAFIEMTNADKSVIDSTKLREGLVCRNYEEGISFKVINPEYLLKKNE